MHPQHLGTIAAAFAVLCAGDGWGAATLTRYPYPQSLGRTQVTFLWRTATPAQQTIDYSADGSYALSGTDAAPTRSHEVTLTGLVPGTTYHYRLREGAEILVQGDPYTFKTDPGRAGKQFAFFVTGDVGESAPDGKQQYTGDMIRRVWPRADLGLLAGDIIYPDGESSAYDAQLMTPWRGLLCNTPVWPTLGNHDWHVDPDSNFAREWALPNNEHWFSFDYGNAHFIALDTADGSLTDEVNQLAWLQQDLAVIRPGCTWTFVYYHYPVLTCTYKGNNAALAAKLLPIFDQYKPDVVFNGHAHTYERLYPIRNGQPVDQSQNPVFSDPQGTIFVVSGCGGKINTGEPTTFCGPTAAFVDERILFTQVFVSDHSLYVPTFDSMSGAIVDYFFVQKTAAPADVALAPVWRRLHQNRPNPFNPTTAIPFETTAAGWVRLRVFRPDGSWVVDLADRLFPAGTHRLVWDGRDARGARVGSGVYVLRMQAEGESESIRMTVLK